VPSSRARREQVGEWIRKRREYLGITGAQLARALDVDAKTITNAENGTHQPRFLARWEDLLRWPRGDLDRAYETGAEPAGLLDASAEGRPLEVGGDPDWIAKVARLDDHGRSVLDPFVDMLLADQDKD
jgi:transcriptional regulator with XRE-family HTH domain